MKRRDVLKASTIGAVGVGATACQPETLNTATQSTQLIINEP